MRRLLPLLTAAFLILTLAGCGGEKSSAALPVAGGDSTELPTGVLTGLVGERVEYTFTLVEEGGRSHTLSLSLAPQETLADLQPGAAVAVEYTGQLGGDVLPSLRSVRPEVSFLPEGIGTGVLSQGVGRAYQVFCTLGEEEKLAQLLLVRGISSGEELTLPAAEGAPDGSAAHISPAGALLEETSFAGKSKKEVRAMTASLGKGGGVPLLLAVEEEGGTHAPVSANRRLAFSPFASQREVFARGGLVALAKDTAQRANWLRGLGISVNLAPVADLANQEEAFLYGRSLGRPAGETAEAIATQVQAYREAGMGCVLRHFPGLGNQADPREELVVDSRSYQQFLQEDLLPFQAGIQAGAPCVMVSHSLVGCMDGQRPASLSPAVCQLLRGNLAFDGVILADDLDAPSLAGREGHPAVEALLAGCDLLLVEDWQGAFAALQQAYQAGEIPQERLDAACLRVLAWKGCMGLLGE